MTELHLTGPLGERLTVAIENAKDLYPTLAKWGQRGFYSGEIPAGGLTVPLDNEPDFHWALLGAYTFTNKEGEFCVGCRGHVYKRREFDALDSRKLSLPRAVKYSRGAKPTDPEHIREKSDGEIEYVTLISFRGGKRNEAFARPG